MNQTINAPMKIPKVIEIIVIMIIKELIVLKLKFYWKMCSNFALISNY